MEDLLRPSTCVPSYPNVVYTCAELHATMMSAAGHGVVDSAAAETQQRESHEEAFGRVDVTGRIKVEEGYRMYAP